MWAMKDDSFYTFLLGANKPAYGNVEPFWGLDFWKTKEKGNKRIEIGKRMLPLP